MVQFFAIGFLLGCRNLCIDLWCLVEVLVLMTELRWLQMENSGVVHMLKNKKTDG